MDATGVGSYIAGVEHVALVVPAHADVEQQALDRTPVVLEVRTELVVGRLHERIATTEPELERNLEVVGLISVSGVGGLRVVELWYEIVPLVDVVGVVVEAQTTLEDMLAHPLETGERYVVAEADTLLDVLLNRRRGADHVVRSIGGIESPWLT